jgi:hypothetical protein
VLQAASRTNTLLPHTLEMINDFDHDLKIVVIHDKTVEENDEVGEELMDIFVDTIQFWASIVRFLRRNRQGVYVPSDGNCSSVDLKLLVQFPKTILDGQASKSNSTQRRNLSGNA